MLTQKFTFRFDELNPAAEKIKMKRSVLKGVWWVERSRTLYTRILVSSHLYIHKATTTLHCHHKAILYSSLYNCAV